MIRLLRTIVPIAALAAVLTGCTSATLDIPAGVDATAAPAATASPAEPAAVAPAPEATAAAVETAPAAPATEALDCATVLPVEAVESALELPTGFVTASEQTEGCAWAMAGNPSALTLQTVSGASSDTLAALEASGATQSSALGDRAFFRAGDPAADPAAALVVLVGDRMLTVRSYVGDQAALEELATDALAALEPDPS